MSICCLQEERRCLDRITTILLLVIFLLSILSHIPSFVVLVRDFRHKYTNNAILIYRHLFVIDLIVIFGYIPVDAVWTLTRQSSVLCMVNRYSSRS